MRKNDTTSHLRWGLLLSYLGTATAALAHAQTLAPVAGIDTAIKEAYESVRDLEHLAWEGYERQHEARPQRRGAAQPKRPARKTGATSGT